MNKYGISHVQNLNIGTGYRIDDSVRFENVKNVEIGNSCSIGPNVRINVKNFKIGIGSEIDAAVQIVDAEEVKIGDYCYIGPKVRIIGGRFTVGDYSKIHNHTYIYSKKYVLLSHNTWVGQNTTLDGTGGIQAGNFLGIGIGSALYSHIRDGDVLEGCRYNRDKELIIENDVWFVGMCLVSPIKAEAKSMALLGSVVVKDMKYNHIYGGNPASDLTEKLGPPWREVSIEEKVSKMNEYIDTYIREVDPSFDRELLVVVEDFPEVLDDRVFYNVKSREYTKHNYEKEKEFNKWLFPFRAKFAPRISK